MTEERTVNDNETAAAEPSVQEPSPQPEGEHRTKRGGGFGAIFAILLALLALAGAGGAGFMAWQQDQARAALEARLTELDKQINERASTASVEALRRSLTDQRETLDDALAQQGKTLRAEVEALRAETRAQQEALDTLRTLTGRDERLWRLGEIDRLLTAAQTRLRLLDDAATARLLLQEADRTAAPLGGEVLPLREAMQQALGTMANGVGLDREGLALRLTQLAESLPELPLASTRPQADAAPAEGWWAQTRAWAASWLRIARKDEAVTARHDPKLQAAPAQLLDARRALLARDTTKASELVKQVTETARARLDGNDARALAALDELNEIGKQLAQPAAVTTDLSPTFAALRALRTASNAHSGKQGE
ncbi:MAG: uroporphyrinogen-III C-methyltransferase [Pseudomonadota bacterium]